MEQPLPGMHLHNSIRRPLVFVILPIAASIIVEHGLITGIHCLDTASDTINGHLSRYHHN